MGALARIIGKVLAGIGSLLVLETSVFGIPESLTKQFAALALLNEYVSVRVLFGVALGLLLAGLAVGPSTLRAWRDSLSDWWNANARETERLRVEGQRAEEGRLEAERQRNDLQRYVRTLERAAGPRNDAEELKHDCRLLAVEIHEFDEECFREKVALLEQARNAETDEERERLQQEAQDPDRRFRATIRWRYETRYRDRAARLLERAAERGWVDQTHVEAARRVDSNLAAIGNVAEMLSKIGCRP